MLSLKSSDPSQHTVHPVFVTGKIDKLSSQDSSVWTHDGTDRIRIDAEIHTADRLEHWKAEGQKKGKPYLESKQYAMPVFYHDVMYRKNTEEKDAAFLKLYDGRDWKWFAVRMKHTDMEYLRKHWSGPDSVSLYAPDVPLH